MALKRCGSCKHWHQRDASDPEVGAVMGGHLAGVCQRITDGITGGTEAYPLAAVIAIVADSGPWLVTSADFGCAAFEAGPASMVTQMRWPEFERKR